MMTRREIAFVLMVAAVLTVLTMLLLPKPAGAALKPRHACLVHEAFVLGHKILAENPSAFAEIPCPKARRRVRHHAI